MPLSSVGIASGQIVKAAQVLQYFNLFTGVMTDQVVTFANTVNGTIFVPTGLTGVTAASRYVGATDSGAPLSGTFQVGDFLIDRSGAIWVCTVAGTPGTWSQVGPALPLSTTNGGLGGDFSASHNQVIVSEGSSAMHGVGPGTSGYPLVSGGTGADPSYAQLTATGIAAQTITASQIANNTIGNSQLAAGTALANIGTGGITDTYIAANTISSDKLTLTVEGPTYLVSQTRVSAGGQNNLCSITCAAGSWLFSGWASTSSASGSPDPHISIYDGTSTYYASTDGLALTTMVTLGGSTTVTLLGENSASSGNDAFFNTTNRSGRGNATGIVGIRIG